MTQPLALIGAGVIGQRHLKAIKTSQLAELVAIADPDPASRSTAAEAGVPHFASTAEMLDACRPTGVIVATPTVLHLRPALAAIEAGCDALVEKPITATVEEAETLAAAAEAHDRRILVGHQRRYYPMVTEAKRVLESGDLGRLVAVSGMWCLRKHEAYYDPDWRKLWPAGPILTNLIHEMDYLRFICGPMTSVQADIGNFVQGFEKEDVASLSLRFANGALGSFILSDQTHTPWTWEAATGENASVPRGGENALRFACTRGGLEFPNLKIWTTTGGEAHWRVPLSASDVPMDLGDAYVRQIDHFAEVIERRAPPLIDAADATATLKATLAVYRAAKTGERLVL